MTRALVTGAAGFIGSRLVRRLVDDGADVRAVDCFTAYGGVERKRTAASSLQASTTVPVVDADLAVDDLGAFLDDVDVVYHLAGEPGVRASWGTGFSDYARNNVVATQRLADAAMSAEVPRIVYASSSSVYGNALTHPTDEEATPQPVSPYGVTKLAGEHILGAYASQGGPSVVALRYFTVYGPGQRPDMALHRLFAAALGGPRFRRFGDGTQVRDLTYVDDVVEATAAAGSAGTAGLVRINVAGGTQVTLAELIDGVGEVVGSEVPVDAQPVAVGDVARTSGAVDVAARLLGWRASVDLDQGLACQLDWHRSEA